MAALLKDAIAPNLVQTLENNPAFIHGGPFANTAHGCNSVIATTTALKLADYVVTEAGCGADLARAVVGLVESGKSKFRVLYPDEMPLWEKIRTIARRLYGASDVEADKRIKDQLADFEKQGFGHFPVCIAKTQFSFTTDANVKGAPSDHVLTVREVRLSAGAEFVVAICGDIMTMPGLPRAPAANTIEVSDDGRITGL